ncbi:hypothetical protein ACMT4L_20495 [Deinococcus sp. A31D244]|uniref:hypothetical protein n=1 Tax=Deinococcus sp. A31D244 TaxID=3397675 RepID=UPI0039E1AEFB
MIFIGSVFLALLWLLWPMISLKLYRINGLDRHSAPALGQFGDLFGGLTSLFTLGALVFSICVNYLQYLQFKEIRHQEKLNNLVFTNGLLMQDEVMDAYYMIQYGKFYYRGSAGKMGHVKNTQVFNDTRMDRHVRDSKSSEVERKVDKLLMTYEQIMIMIESGSLDKSMVVPFTEKANRIVKNEYIRIYLINLLEYYGSIENSPYRRLTALSL